MCKLYPPPHRALDTGAWANVASAAQLPGLTAPYSGSGGLSEGAAGGSGL